MPIGGKGKGVQWFLLDLLGTGNGEEKESRKKVTIENSLNNFRVCPDDFPRIVPLKRED